MRQPHLSCRLREANGGRIDVVMGSVQLPEQLVNMSDLLCVIHSVP